MENANLRKRKNILHTTGKYLVPIAVAISMLLGAHLLWQTGDNKCAAVWTGQFQPLFLKNHHPWFLVRKRGQSPLKSGNAPVYPVPRNASVHPLSCLRLSLEHEGCASLCARWFSGKHQASHHSWCLVDRPVQESDSQTLQIYCQFCYA